MLSRSDINHQVFHRTYTRSMQSAEYTE